MSASTIDYDKLAAQAGGTPHVDYDALAAQHGGTPVQSAPPQSQDTRNGVQKFVDNLTNVTPEQEKGHSWLTNKVQEFGAGAIQGLTQPIVHPLDTLNALGTTLAHPIDTGKAMIKSAVAHPAQSLGNVVGGVVLGETAAPVAQAAANAAGNVGSRALLLGKTPAEAYESALKPSTTLSQADRAAIVQTGLQNSIPVSKTGLEKVGALIENYNNQIEAQIAADPTRQINPVPALNNLQSVRAKFANQVTPASDLQQIDDVGREFANRFNTGSVGPVPQGTMNAADAQAMKQGTYQALGSKSYGEVKGASIEAQKALARGLKDEIATQFPEIGNLNAEESKLLDLEPVLERAINRTSNHQLIGIGTPIAGAAAKAVTGSGTVGVVAGTLKAVLDNPMVKSRLAISLSKGAKIPYAQALGRIGAYSSALDSASETPEN